MKTREGICNEIRTTGHLTSSESKIVYDWAVKETKEIPSNFPDMTEVFSTGETIQNMAFFLSGDLLNRIEYEDVSLNNTSQVDVSKEKVIQDCIDHRYLRRQLASKTQRKKINEEKRALIKAWEIGYDYIQMFTGFSRSMVIMIHECAAETMYQLYNYKNMYSEGTCFRICCDMALLIMEIAKERQKEIKNKTA